MYQYAVLLALFSIMLQSHFAVARQASLPKLGERVYSLVADELDSESLAKSSEIAQISTESKVENSLKDPLVDREISLKKVLGRSRYVTPLDVQDNRPKVKTAFVKLSPMAIFGKSNKPRLSLDIERPGIESSDALKTPDLLDGLYQDAKKLK